jgi:hypothetical protein
MRRTLLAALALAALAGNGPALGRAGEDTVLVLVTLRDQPAVRFASAEPPLVAAGLSASEADDAGASRTNRLMRRLSRSLPDAQAPVVSHVRRLGGELVYAARAFNAVSVRVPVSSIAELAARADVAAVEIDEPRPALLDAVAGSMLVAPFWSAGRLGGAVDVAVIDTGLYEQHEAYAPRAGSIASAVFHDAARLRGEYYDFPDDPDDYGGHGTFVSGLVFSQGSAVNAQRLGIAHGIDKLYNLKAGYAVYPSGGSSLLSDVMKAVDWALAQPDPPEVFNYSYGARLSTDDDAYSRFWDGVVDGFGKVATISAGNSGPGAGTVASPGMAYNVISVANVATKSTASRADDNIATSSSRGPTPGGRKKPDLTAPGSSIWLPSHYGRATWLQVTGTSFSSPGIAAASALLIDAGVTDPRAVKAVLLNSADDLGTPGWDAAYGWGYYNGERAWAERDDVVVASYAASGAASRRYFERTTSAPTKATLVWNRHVNYEPGLAVPASGVLNDLDLSLYETRGGALRAASASPRDNVEQVVSSESEPTVLVVQSSGAFSGSSEDAALAHGGGFVERAGPGVAVTLSAPGTAMPASTFAVTVALRNSGDLRGHAYTVALELPAGFALAEGTLAQSAATLAPGEQSLLTWSVSAPATPRLAQLLGVSASGTAYGRTWTATASVAMAAATGCTYAVAPPGQAPAGGGVVAVEVTATAGCAWSAAAGDGWFTIDTGATGAGIGTVTLNVTPNRLAVERSGTLSVSGVSVPVTQAASAGPRRYYLAEGATGPLFDLDVAIANPNAEVAPVTVRFMRPDGSIVEQAHQVGPLNRLTIHVNDVAGLAAGDVSTVVESTNGLDLAVERTMTWDADGYGGHSGTAVESPQPRWYFAEGSQGYFDTYLLLANPGESTAHVAVTFLLEDAPPFVHRVDVGPTSRTTVFAGDLAVLRTRSFSVVVESDTPVIAERSMYWSAAGAFWVGGHESAGVASPALRWSHAEGATGAFFDTYLLLANPNDAATQVRVTYLLPDGSIVVTARRLPARSRTTIDVESEDGRLADTAVSIAVEADAPVVSERAMYWPGWPWQEAHDSFGQTMTAARWAVADGCEGGPLGRETYILVANPGETEVPVQVTFLREGRLPLVKAFAVGATSRFNVAVGAVAPELSGECFGALVESPSGASLVVERATYWNAKGATWAGGTNAAGTPLR